MRNKITALHFYLQSVISSSADCENLHLELNTK